ncbi:MAG: hypothetical protein JWR10_2790 [Rubritepida sp.]|nr:hypothetical protein [Rubritepida sp.]
MGMRKESGQQQGCQKREEAAGTEPEESMQHDQVPNDMASLVRRVKLA